MQMASGFSPRIRSSYSGALPRSEDTTMQVSRQWSIASVVEMDALEWNRDLRRLLEGGISDRSEKTGIPLRPTFRGLRGFLEVLARPAGNGHFFPLRGRRHGLERLIVQVDGERCHMALIFALISGVNPALRRLGRSWTTCDMTDGFPEGSETNLQRFALPVDEFRPAAVGESDPELAAPGLSFLQRDPQRPVRIVPVEAGEGVVAFEVAEAAVVLIEREASVGARIDADGERFID